MLFKGNIKTKIVWHLKSAHKVPYKPNTDIYGVLETICSLLLKYLLFAELLTQYNITLIAKKKLCFTDLKDIKDFRKYNYFSRILSLSFFLN